MTLILNGTDNSATTPAVTGTDPDTGVFFPAANVVAFSTSGSEDARFDSAGNLLIGTTSQAPLVGAGKYLTLYNTSNTTLSIQSVDSNNDRNATLELLSSGAGGSSSQLVYGDTRTVSSTQSPLVFASYYSLTRAETLRLNTTGNLVLKGGNVNATGVGVSFPATQVASSDANCLDDYEEGTWTPTASADTAPTGVTYSIRSGFYRKVGQLVTVTLRMVMTSYGTGGSGSFIVAGLPFTCLNMGLNIPCGGFYEDNPGMPSGRTWAVPQANGNTTNISLIAAGNAVGATTMTYANISAGNDISIGLTYFSDT